MKYIKLLIIALLLIIPVTAHALDKKLGATNCFKIGVFDEIGGGIAGLDVITPFSDTITKIQCGANSVVPMNETGDTVADEGGGYYYICTNDTITSNVEEECLAWVEGEDIAAGVIAKSPVKFKAVGATMSHVGLLKSITISSATTSTITSSGLSEASNRDYIGGIINCPNATAADNRMIFLKIISFNPATDTITLNGLFATALSANDVCDIYIDTVR